MGTQHMLVIHVEGVMHGPRRVILRYVQGGEIVEIGLDFGAFGHFETDGVKQFLDTLQGQRHRMQAALGPAAAGQCHVQGFARQLQRLLGGQKSLPPGLQGLFDALLDHVDGSSRSRTLLVRELAQAFEQIGQCAALAHETGLGLLQVHQVAASGKFTLRIRQNLF
ncbi:hypothetical protein GALL_424370 [mine drainage metagenome]|uniref:Uncharacterized protein n=1 Tax=mine drainage metagenome TaxID=410659 RepID=A0A1J5PWM5_9ZZZZ